MSIDLSLSWFLNYFGLDPNTLTPAHVIMFGYPVSQCPYSRKAVEFAKIYAYGHRGPSGPRNRVIHVVVPRENSSLREAIHPSITFPIVFTRSSDPESENWTYIGGGNDMEKHAQLAHVSYDAHARAQPTSDSLKWSEPLDSSSNAEMGTTDRTPDNEEEDF